MNTCDIDKLRDLVRRQVYAKNRHLDRCTAPALAEVDVERQVNTYLAAGTTVGALTKCVEQIEREMYARLAEERARRDQREEVERVRRVCEAAENFDIHLGTTKGGKIAGAWEYGYAHNYSLRRDIDRIRETIKLRLKELDA